MRAIPPEMTLDEFDRHAVQELLARRQSGDASPAIPGERARRFLVELQAKFDAAGFADPAIIEEMLDKVKVEVSL